MGDESSRPRSEVRDNRTERDRAESARLARGECPHPREALSWMGDFAGPPDQWLFRIDCLRCSGSWDHDSDEADVPWEQVTEMLDEGKFSRLQPDLEPSAAMTRATAMVTARTAEILRDLQTMGTTRFPID